MAEQKAPQRPEPTEEQKKQMEEQKKFNSRMFVIKLMGNAVNGLFNMLSQLPAKDVMPMLMELQKQVQEQMPEEKEEKKNDTK